MSNPFLRLADRLGLLFLIGTLPLVAIAPYGGANLARTISVLWYALGVAAMLFYTSRAARTEPSVTEHYGTAGPPAIRYRLLGAIVLAFVGLVVTTTIIPGRANSVTAARWTGREAAESADLRDIIYACSIYSLDSRNPRHLPTSLATLRRWLVSPVAARKWRSSSLSPSRSDLEHEAAALQHDRSVVYLGRGVPASGAVYIVLVAQMHGPDGRTRFLVGKSDATVAALSADGFKKALRRDERLRVDRRLPLPAPELKWLGMERPAHPHGRRLS